MIKMQKKEDTEVSLPEVKHCEYPQIFNITVKIGIVGYYKGYFFMEEPVINDWKVKVFLKRYHL